RRTSVGAILGRVLWLQGYAAEAEQTARMAVDIAARGRDGVGLGLALGLCGCPVAILDGQLEFARGGAALLFGHHPGPSLSFWRQYGECYELLLSRFEDSNPEPALLARLAAGGLPPQLLELLATLHPDLATETAFTRGEDGRAGWCTAELLRLRALRIAEA